MTERAATVALAAASILELIEARLEPLVLCSACGCLCRPSEVCPNCHPTYVSGGGRLD